MIQQGNFITHIADCFLEIVLWSQIIPNDSLHAVCCAAHVELWNHEVMHHTWYMEKLFVYLWNTNLCNNEVTLRLDRKLWFRHCMMNVTPTCGCNIVDGNGWHWHLIFSDYWDYCHFKNIPDALIRKITSKIHSAGYIYLLNVEAYFARSLRCVARYGSKPQEFLMTICYQNDTNTRYSSMLITVFVNK